MIAVDRAAGLSLGSACRECLARTRTPRVEAGRREGTIPAPVDARDLGR